MTGCRGRRICGIVFAAVGAILVAGVAGQEYTIDRYTVDGGGAMRSTSRGIELSGTAAQPDAGTLRGGKFELHGGFWFPISKGDCEEDGDVDLFDYDVFEGCLAGPAGAAPAGVCRCFDVNGSNRVDLLDWSLIQTGFTG